MNQSKVTEIVAMVLAHNREALRTVLKAWAIPDIVDVLLQLEKPTRVLLFRYLPRETAAAVFSDLKGEDADALLKELTDEETRLLLEYMRPDDRTTFLDELPGQVIQRLLNLLSPEDLTEARTLLGYPERSVGRLMTPEYVAIRPDWTVSRCMQQVRERGHDSETVDTLYVVNPRWKLMGAVSLRQLITAKPEALVKNIMTTPAISLSAFDHREEAFRVMNRHDLSVLPVVASDGVMVGIVTADDVYEIVEEETTEDFQRAGAVTPFSIDYKEASLWLLVRSRLGWLVALIVADLVVAKVMTTYEGLISKTVALVFFLPLVLDCSGNTGSQSSTLVVRDLALGEVRYGDWGRLILKETLVAGALGVSVGLAVWGPALYQGGLTVANIVAIGSLATVAAGGVVGVALPLVLSKIGFDPATASSPLITSVADIAGTMIYFYLATRFLVG